MDVVIARYEEDMGWIVSDLVPRCSPDRIVVYNKGKCQSMPSAVQVTPLPNVGREAHTYLHHIIDTYHSNDEDVVTLFIPGSCRDLPYKWESVLKVVAEISKKKGSVFPCTACKDVDLEQFSIDSHVGSHGGNAKANPISALVPSPIRPYGRWCREVLGEMSTDCLTYWGIFAVSQRDIRSRPLEMYVRLKSFVDRDPNHEAAHYLERAWPVVFGFKPRQRIVIMVIASPGFEYECMRHVWLMHWQHASRWLGPDAELWFLHGQGKSASPRVSDHDRFYADVDESLIPGILDKTMLAFRDALDAGADVVVRTNLSSFYMWKRLADFLRDTFGEPKPSAADKCTLPGVADKCTLPGVAGFSPDRSHFSGCNMILSRATVQWLVDRDADLDRTLIDDVAISRLLVKHSPVPHRWISRLDIADRVLHNAPRGLAEVFHVRVKSGRRIDDARTMYDLMLRHRDHPDFLI